MFKLFFQKQNASAGMTLLFLTLFACFFSYSVLAENKPQSLDKSYKSNAQFTIKASGAIEKPVRKPTVIQPEKKAEKLLNISRPASLTSGYGKAKENLKIHQHQQKTAVIATKEKPKTNIQVQQQTRKPGEEATVFDLINANDVPLDSYTRSIVPAKQKTVEANVRQFQNKSAIVQRQIPKRLLPVVAQKPSSKKLRKAVVVIDPGHGGKDPGATGKLGNREKNIVLAYSRALRDELNRNGRYIVKMTRDSDTFIPLPDRVKIARRSGGDILISIHADSHPNPNTRGFSIYTISKDRASREAGKLLAKSEYEEIIRGVPLKGQSKDVKEALIFISQNETKDISDEFSKILARNLGRKAKPLPKSNREASLAVLTGADIPSVLLELGYMSNTYEERLLATAQQRQKMVGSIVNAIDEYFRTYDYLLE